MGATDQYGLVRIVGVVKHLNSLADRVGAHQQLLAIGGQAALIEAHDVVVEDLIVDDEFVDDIDPVARLLTGADFVAPRFELGVCYQPGDGRPVDARSCQLAHPVVVTLIQDIAGHRDRGQQQEKENRLDTVAHVPVYAIDP